MRIICPRLADVGSLCINSKYGTRFNLKFPEDRGWEFLYARGTYESGTSDLCKRILAPGDTVIDVGANIGWYTYLFATSVSPTGRVYAFEPSPWVYEELTSNCILNQCGNVVHLNRTAIGGTEGLVDLYDFQGCSHAEASIVKQEGLAVRGSARVAITTLDAYTQRFHINHVDLIKVDAEGSELQILDGAKRLLNRHRPMWLFEVNFVTARAAGWSPLDLLRCLQDKHGYCFVRVKTGWGEAKEVSMVEEFEHGDNALCFVPELHTERLLPVMTRIRDAR